MFATLSLSIFLSAYIYYEYLRYNRSLDVTFQQHEDFKIAFAQSSCRHDGVVSAEWRGNTYDCNSMRLLLQRRYQDDGYYLWWHTSGWVGLWERIGHNPWIVTVIIIVSIIAVLYFTCTAWTAARFQDRIMIQNEKFLEARETMKSLASPPPRVYHDDDDNTYHVKEDPRRKVFRP